jgi:hypothetical protein
MVAVVKARPELGVVIATLLPINFDTLTKTTLVADSIAGLNAENVTKYVGHVLAGEHGERIVVDQAAKVLGNTRIEGGEWIRDALCFLAGKDWERFFSALESVCKRKMSGTDWVKEMIVFLGTEENELMSQANELEKLAEKHPSLIRLGHLVLLHDFAKPMEFDGVFPELLEIAKNLGEGGSKRTRQADFAPHDVLLDVLLGLLSGGDKILREAALSCFEGVCAGGIGAEGVKVLFEVLYAKNDNAGEELFERVDDEEDTADEEEENVDDEEESEQEDEVTIIAPVTGEVVDSDDGLDDDEMAAFDDKLVEIFKEKKRLKDEKKGMLSMIS